MSDDQTCIHGVYTKMPCGACQAEAEGMFPARDRRTTKPVPTGDERERLRDILCDDEDRYAYKGERHDRTFCGHNRQADRLIASGVTLATTLEPDRLREDDAATAERRRLASALANWALSRGESFRTLLPFLDLAYAEAYREGWMAFTNAIYDRMTRAAFAASRPMADKEPNWPGTGDALDVERLARALVASDLMRRYSEYAIDAHEWTMAREPIDALADEWAAIIAREYEALTASPASTEDRE